MSSDKCNVHVSNDLDLGTFPESCKSCSDVIIQETWSTQHKSQSFRISSTQTEIQSQASIFDVREVHKDASHIDPACEKIRANFIGTPIKGRLTSDLSIRAFREEANSKLGRSKTLYVLGQNCIWTQGSGHVSQLNHQSRELQGILRSNCCGERNRVISFATRNTASRT